MHGEDEECTLDACAKCETLPSNLSATQLYKLAIAHSLSAPPQCPETIALFESAMQALPTASLEYLCCVRDLGCFIGVESLLREALSGFEALDNKLESTIEATITNLVLAEQLQQAAKEHDDDQTEHEKIILHSLSILPSLSLPTPKKQRILTSLITYQSNTPTLALHTAIHKYILTFPDFAYEIAVSLYYYASARGEEDGVAEMWDDCIGKLKALLGYTSNTCKDWVVDAEKLDVFIMLGQSLIQSSLFQMDEDAVLELFDQGVEVLKKALEMDSGNEELAGQLDALGC